VDNNKIASHQSADHIILGINPDEQKFSSKLQREKSTTCDNNLLTSLHFLMETSEPPFVSLYGIYSSILMAFAHVC
jgi:hypothetical protein